MHAGLNLFNVINKLYLNNKKRCAGINISQIQVSPGFLYIITYMYCLIIFYNS